MALQHTNNNLIGSAFDAMRDSLGGFEMREMIRNYGDAWWTEGVRAHLYDDQRQDVAPASETDDVKRIDSMDILLMLRLVIQSWKDVFRAVMDRRSQTWARELIDTRNTWAHVTGEGFNDDDTARALDTMARFMEGIDAETATEIRGYYRELVERDVVTVDAVEATIEPAVGETVQPARHQDGSETLRAWRTVVAPKADVARGRFKTAEFALDLATIAKGDGSFEYQDPREFFARTYITQGMRSLLITALKRVSVTDDDDGDPVVELKTAFGGGKTHSMLAVYHLMRNSKGCKQLPGIEEVMEEARVPSLPEKVYVATLVGTDLNPTQAKNPPFLNGKVNTLWGEMAYQLCMQKGDPEPYSIIRSADSKSIAPGTETLVQFFNSIGPCVILMDEFIAYARNLYGADDRRLPAGTFENVLSFMQQLTEAVKRTENCMLIASLPESNRELGGEGGQIALERVEHVFGRVNTIWRAATNEEGFEIVKRRLFQDYNENLVEPVVDTFMAYYQNNSDKFPIECHEHSYRKRMLACYPIHPQVFDRLYSDWSTLENFQRTRGVLRLMATVIHNLWEANDADPLIMPGSVDFSDSRISEEIFQYLDPTWNAVVDNDVDGENSVPVTIDRGGRYAAPRAAKRLARTMFLGSAPSGRGESSRGLETADIRLGAAMPGVEVTIYDDALGKMRDELSYLYTTGTRYWYDTHPTLEKLARERASHVERHAVEAEVVNLVRASERNRNTGFGNVYIAPGSTLDVPDEPVLSLVIIAPSKSHKADQENSAAQVFAADCLSMRGESLRTNRNMLLFCAIDNTLLRRDVTEAVQRYLAWKSIDDEAERLELTRTARQEVTSKLNAAKERASRQVLGAYKHMLCPSQAPGDLRSVEWDTVLIAGNEAVSKRAFEKAKRDEAILVQYSPFLLDKDLKDTLMAAADHMSIGELFDDFCRYGYLRRFVDAEVLRECIAQGVASKDYFAYADGYDEEKGRYYGLKLGERPFVDMRTGLVVKREVALEQMAFEHEQPPVVPGGGGGEIPGSETVEPGGDDYPGDEPEPPAKPVIRDVSIEAALNKLTAGMEVGTIVEEMLQPLYDVGGTLATLTFTADITVPDGIDDDLLRMLRENANTLGVTLRLR